MAGDISLALRTAQSGLLTNQTALNAVANNIANVNSVGYSRKIINLEQRVVSGAGAGVQISEIARRIDEGLLKSLRLQLSDFNAIDIQTTFFERMQELFGAPGDNTSIAHIFEEFSTAVETLAVSPDRLLEQSDVVRWGENIAIKLQDMSTAIQDLRKQADEQIADIVERINALTTRIRDLNDEIISRGTVGRDVSDLKDQRDQAVDELSTLVDIRYFFRSDGDIIVFTSGGRTLVDNQPAVLAHDAAASVTPTTTHAEGDFDGLFIGEEISGNDITNEIRGGKLKGLIDLRDDILPNLQSQIDHLAATLRDTVNQVHNRGTPFPGLQSVTGSRTFTEPGTQTIRLDPTGSADDVTIALFNSTGDQSATITLNTLMTSASFGGAQASRGPWTINIVATKLQNWLQANGVASATVSASTGRLVINLNTTSLNLAFRDQAATANGSAAADAEIGFDADGNGTVDQTVFGFSYFFGLNDFFVDNLAENVKESDVQSASFSSGSGTLVFRDSSGAMTGSPVTITAGSSLSTIATTINNAVPNVTASVVPDGAGFRLRIAHDQGSSFVLTQTAGTLLTTLSMHEADVRVASSLAVRSDIVDSPSLISRGLPQWNANLGAAGQYFMSVGDDTIVQALATKLTTNVSFKQAGGLGAISTTLTEYATNILARNANLADSQKTDNGFARGLAESLQQKSDDVRGVNLDEEMATLIQFQQAYSAAARVITTIQKMFDALDRAVA
jgi:flagellar hook-associated protein 1 FlgK